ncbi:hypothetical protein D3C83_262400 [compost metagenome]
MIAERRKNIASPTAYISCSFGCVSERSNFAPLDLFAMKATRSSMSETVPGRENRRATTSLVSSA